MALKEYYNLYFDGTTTTTANVYGVYQSAQIFTAASSYSIASVKLLLFRTGDPGDLTITLQAVTTGRPNGSVLATGTTSANTLTTDASGDWREITFETPYSIVDTTLYAIVASAGGDSSNKVRWQADLTSPEYGGGTKCWSSNAGASWTIDGTKDMMFENYSALEVFEVTASIAGVSAISATQSRSQTSSATPDSHIQYRTRLVACNNDQFWYEE